MKAVALALLGFIAVVPLLAANLVPDPFQPTQVMSLYIEKHDGDSVISIQLAGDALTYKVVKQGKVTDETVTHPLGDDWFKFIQGLNNAKVYKWTAKYYYPGQGASWFIDLGMENRPFKSEGTNEYPKEGAEDQPQADPKAGASTSFLLFWQAALELAGKAPPPAPAK